MRDIHIPRRVLLVEVERRCPDANCTQKARIGLTKEEARAYTGFACERCERWTPDALTERDVPPEWWQDFVLQAHDETLVNMEQGRLAPDAPETIKRLSNAYRRERKNELPPEE